MQRWCDIVVELIHIKAGGCIGRCVLFRIGATARISVPSGRVGFAFSMSEYVEANKALQLYCRWERQHWHPEALDFARDRADWLALTDHERWQWYKLAGFYHFRKAESDVMVGLAALLPCLQSPEQQIALSAQIADEARHTFFFERFHREVLSAALPTAHQGNVTVSPAYRYLLVDSVNAVVRETVNDPCPATLAKAIFHIFVLLEGSFALAGFTQLRQLLSRTGLFPGFLAGLTLAHRDESRHTQLGLFILKDILAKNPSCRAVVTEYLDELLPTFSKVLELNPGRKVILESLDLNPYLRREKTFGFLNRHLRVLGLDNARVQPWMAAA